MCSVSLVASQEQHTSVADLALHAWVCLSAAVPSTRGLNALPLCLLPLLPQTWDVLVLS